MLVHTPPLTGVHTPEYSEAMTNLTWDDLPGDSASHIADIEQTVKFLAQHLDNDRSEYELVNVLEDMQTVQHLATQAITLLERGW